MFVHVAWVTTLVRASPPLQILRRARGPSTRPDTCARLVFLRASYGFTPIDIVNVALPPRLAERNR